MKGISLHNETPHYKVLTLFLDITWDRRCGYANNFMCKPPSHCSSVEDLLCRGTTLHNDPLVMRRKGKYSIGHTTLIRFMS